MGVGPTSQTVQQSAADIVVCLVGLTNVKAHCPRSLHGLGKPEDDTRDAHLQQFADDSGTFGLARLLLDTPIIPGHGK